jgi:PAS domain S-box-containing protein
MKDERKTKKQLIDELAALRQQVTELETSEADQELQTKPLRDLIELIHFTENVSTRIHGLLDEAEIYGAFKDEFLRSKRYTATILLLTDDAAKLRIAESSIPARMLKAAEKATGLRLKGFQIDLSKSSLYSRVVKGGETVRIDVVDLIGEFLPRRPLNLVTKILRYEGELSILTPLERRAEIAGVLSMSSTGLAEHFVPSVQNLARHISTALELAGEYAEHRRTEEELAKYRDHLEGLVEERTAALMQTNEQLRREITERKRAEQALRESEEMYRTLVDTSPDAVTVTDVEGLITHVSQQALEMHGVEDAGELVGKSAFELIAPEDRELAMANLQKTLTGESVRNVEYTLLRHDRTRFTGELNAALIRDAGGAPKAFIATTRDVTDRRQAEEKLQAEKERAQLYLDVAGVSIIAFDREGRVTLINRRGLEILGYREEDLIGKHWVETCLPERVRDEVAGVFERILAGDVEPVSRRENLVLTKGGEERIVAWHNAILRDAAGDIVGILSSGEDVTERKQAEEALALRVEQLTALSQASQAVTSSLDLDWVLAEIVSRASKVVASDYTSVVLVDEAGHLRESADNVPGVPAIEYRIRDEGLTRWIVRSRQAAIIDDVDETGAMSPRLGEGAPRLVNPPIAEAGVRSLAGLPLAVQERLLGVLYLHSLRPGAFRDQLPLLTTFANQIAIAIENARLYEAAQQELAERVRAEEALQRYAERLRVLHTIDEAVLSAWSAEEIALAALRHLHRLMHCERANVTLFDFESQEATVLAAYPEDKSMFPAGTRLPLEGVLHEVETLRQGRVLVEEDLNTHPNPPAAIQVLLAAGVRSYIAAPLISRDGLAGTLTVAPEGPVPPTQEYVDAVSEVAAEVALALDQARLRAALEAEQKRLKTLVEHLPEGVLLLDGEQRILLTNPVADGYLQALADTGEPATRTGDILDNLAGWPAEELTQAGPEGLWREMEVAGPPGRIFGVAAQPVKAEDQLAGWVLLIWDVTREREAERKDRQQERLAAVGQLAGGIAHDFNNLLTTILLYAQMLLRKPHLPPDLAPSVETIIDESRRAARLVQQILDFGRRAMMEIRPVDLVSFVEETIDILRRTFPENIHILIELESEGCVVNADPTRIQQVLMNLAVNARDAMPEGGELRIALSRIEVGAREKPPVSEMPAGKWVCLAISDTGVGIAPDALPHIYEPFFTTKPVGEGTGLGLSQVYGIVKQHEGYIDMETEVGKGTTFRIYLPAHGAMGIGEDMRDSEPPPMGSEETILLVEDEDRLREVGHKMLESLGYRVLTATNGKEALETYRSAEGVDLVMTDLVMPKMGGLELVQSLREIDPHVKALAITGYAVKTDIQELKDAGILEIVRKPFGIDTLGRIVREVLDAGQ